MDERGIQTDRTQVVAAVIRRDELYLLCQRAQGKRHALLWEFPGGKCEPGESLRDAAQREVAEELGVQVISVGSVIHASVDPLSGFNINFVDVAIDGEPKAIEHAEIRWISLTDALKLPLAPSDLKFIEYVTRR
ncbi:MAG TPA: NUDIX domain-containing protein [Planktothrix sp.]|jgi:mutator protein MutT